MTDIDVDVWKSSKKIHTTTYDYVERLHTWTVEDMVPVIFKIWNISSDWRPRSSVVTSKYARGRLTSAGFGPGSSPPPPSPPPCVSLSFSSPSFASLPLPLPFRDGPGSLSPPPPPPMPRLSPPLCPELVISESLLSS